MRHMYHYMYMGTQMQTGLVVFLTGDLPAILCSHLVVLLLFGASKKQPMVALSSTVEYRGAAVAACEVAWLCKLLVDLGLHVERKIVIYCDNLSSIQLVRNPLFHAQTKHIEVHYHFI